MMKDEYIKTFASTLRSDDVLIMPDIFYVGGSANLVNGEVVALPQDISSSDVIEPVRKAGKEAVYIPKRGEIVSYLKERAEQGDVVIVMGSRDESLSEFACEIVQGLR